MTAVRTRTPGGARAALRLVGALSCALLVGGVAPATPATAAGGRSGPCTAADTNAVTVVIDYKELGGGIDKYCATNLPKGAVGMDALRAVGVATTGTTHDGNGFVCRLNGKPTAGESIRIPGNDDYRENCVNTPPATAYWAYWWAEPGGSWVYSSKGVLSRRVVFGGYEGWSFANDPDGGYGGKNPPPGVKPVAPAPLPSPTPKPTPTPTKTRPSPAPTSSRTPKPTKSAATGSRTPTAGASPEVPGSATATPSPAQDSDSATPPATTATSAAAAPVQVPPSSGPASGPSEVGTGPGGGLVIAALGVAGAAAAATVIAVRRRRTR